MSQSGGRFNFDDGGVYCGAWEEGKAHGQGICTGPKGQGEYAGSWNHGFEVLGVYTWPSGNTYEGNWSMGKRHGLGIEVKGKWEYRGEWTHGYKGRYGVRSNLTSRAKYEGAWANGLQDGCGTETYDDGGTYQGQWNGGMRHGYGVRQSVTYGMASATRKPWMMSMTSLRSEINNGNFPTNDVGMSMGNCDSSCTARAGFVLSRRPAVASCLPTSSKRNKLFRSSSTTFGKSLMGGLKSRTKSNMSIASGTSNKSYQSTMTTESLTSALSDYNSVYERRDVGSRMEQIEDDIDVNTTETFYGEWKTDARTGYGVCEHSDGLVYEGEWFQNQRHGYGVTKFPNGTKEEGKYKYNAIITSSAKKKNFALKSNKTKIKVTHAVEQAQKAKEIALQKSETAISRAAHSVARANLATAVAKNAREEAHIARCVARDQDPQFQQPGLEYVKLRGSNSPGNINDSILTESESRDVQGPESYFQYSSQQSDPAPAAPLNVARDEMRKPSAAFSSRPGPSFDRNASNDRNHVTDPLQNSRQVQYPPQDQQSFSAPSEKHHLNRSRPKSNGPSPTHLAPNYPIAETPSTGGGISKKEMTGSNTSLANSSTPRHKKGFFRSLRIRGKKHSNPETEIDGPLSGSNRNEKSDKEVFGVARNQLAPGDGSTARERRRAFQKSTSAGNRLNFSVNRSMDVGSFDYESNQDVYLASYESEMRGNDEEKRLNQEVLIPSSTNQNQFSKATSRAAPSSYVTVEQIKVPGDGSHNRGIPANDLEKQSLQSNKRMNSFGDSSQQRQEMTRQRYNPENRADTSQITSFQAEGGTRPSSTENQANETCNASPQRAASFLETTENRESSVETSSKMNGMNKGMNRNYEEYSYGGDFSASLPHFSNVDYSPLPNKLRKRLLSEGETSSDHDIPNETSAGDATKFFVIILVFLLITGFMFIFLQFLT